MADRYFRQLSSSGANFTLNNTANWSTTSGGSGGASVPTSADNAFFDANSGSGNAGGSTGATNGLTCLNWNTTGYPGTFNTGATVAAFGDVVLGADATHVTLTLSATSGTKNLTNNGHSFDTVIINGVGGTFSNVDNYSCTGTTTFTNGTFNDNNKNIFSESFALGSGTKTITYGSGAWTCGTNTTGTKWNFNTNSAGLTINGSGGGTILCGNGGAAMTFATGGKTYPMDFQPFTGGGIVTLQNTGATFNSLSLAAGTSGTLRLTAGIALNVGTLKNGSASQAVDTTAAGSAASINVTSTVVAQCVVSSCSFKDITASGSTIYDPSGTNVSGNTNIVFANPPADPIIITGTM